MTSIAAVRAAGGAAACGLASSVAPEAAAAGAPTEAPVALGNAFGMSFGRSCASDADGAAMVCGNGTLSCKAGRDAAPPANASGDGPSSGAALDCRSAVFAFPAMAGSVGAPVAGGVGTFPATSRVGGAAEDAGADGGRSPSSVRSGGDGAAGHPEAEVARSDPTSMVAYGNALRVG
jgi:hypothetical protein